MLKTSSTCSAKICFLFFLTAHILLVREVKTVQNGSSECIGLEHCRRWLEELHKYYLFEGKQLKKYTVLNCGLYGH